MVSASKYPRFVTLIFGAMFIYLVAVLFHLPTLFFMSAALIVAPVVSYLLAAGGLRGIEAERRLPARLWPDERIEVELRLCNHNWLPKCLLRVDEQLPDGLEGDPEDPPGCVVPMLWGEVFIHRYPLTARYRGRYRLAPPVTTAVDTFDLFRARREVGPANEVIVYPRRVPLKSHELSAPNLAGAVRRQRPTASGTDFRATREYQPGDDLRRVHWRSTARRGKPIVMEFEEPATTDLFVILDVSDAARVGVGKQNTFETAVTVAASVIEHELEHDNTVGLLLDSKPAVHFPLTRERHDLLRFMEALAVVEPDPSVSFAATLGRAAEIVPSSAVVLAITCCATAPVLAALGQLMKRRSVALAWVDPSGYAGGDGAGGGEFLAQTKALGVSVFRIEGDEIAAGLARPL